MNPTASKAAAKQVALVARAIRKGSKKRLVVWGNCQAPALANILSQSQGLRQDFSVFKVPAVHEVSARQVPTLMRVIRNTDVLITQPVRSNYRSLPIGTSDIRTALAPTARVLTFPSIYFRGFHPYLCYVHAKGPLGTPAPTIGGYHDLRFIAEAVTNIRTEADSCALKAAYDESLQTMQVREKALDIKVSDHVKDLGVHSFWTVNHPSNALLLRVATAVHEQLGVEPIESLAADELLGELKAPLLPEVGAAVEESARTSDTWFVGHRQVSDSELRRSHLDFYSDRARLLSAAWDEHGDELRRLGLV